MLLAIASMSIVLAVLILQLAVPRAWRATKAWADHESAGPLGYDQGRELRAEQRARELLRSCVDEEEWYMYRDLGFIRVWGSLSSKPGGHGERRRLGGSTAESRVRAKIIAKSTGAGAEADYAYLIYPHRPIIAYLPQTSTLLNEYCVAFPDRSKPYGSSKLPASDDVLAKWMALKADERRLVAEANMHLPGRQVDPGMVRRDLSRLARWERERLAARRRGRLEAEPVDRGTPQRHAMGA